jgi:anti-sigma B factor antagonist
MPINVKREKKLVQLLPEGEMTIYQAAEFMDMLLDGIRGENEQEIEINLSGVTEMDTAGFQLLVMAKSEAVNRNKTLRLVSHGAVTLEIMDLYNMASYFGDPVVITH